MKRFTLASESRQNGSTVHQHTRAAALVAAVAAASLGASVSSAAVIDINGGSSWGGWSYRGNSLNDGVWGAGSTTRSYELYTTEFTFNSNSITGGTQVRNPNTPLGFAAGASSTGAFANGNRIFGFGVKMNGTARAVGDTFVQFGLSGNDFRAASALGAGDGRTTVEQWGRTGDFSIWLNHGTMGPSNLAVMTNDGTSQGGTGSYTNLVGSGVTYDFAFRMFRNGDVGGSYQIFFDLTAMQNLYRSSGSNYITSGWAQGLGSIGTIGSNFNISVFNGDNVDGNIVALGGLPTPGAAALLGLGGLLAPRRRR